MRDLLSKLDEIIGETTLKSKDDLAAKRKALQDLQMDPVASEDPAIKQAIIQRKSDLEKEAKSKGFAESFHLGDDFGISFSEDFEVETEIVGFTEDGIVIDLDDTALEHLQTQGLIFIEGSLEENLEEGKGPCWVGYKQVGMKKKGGKQVPNCVKEDTYKNEDHGPENPNAPVNYGEYDREGDMAKDDLRTIDDAVEELYSILRADENLPEWVQSKITKAVDYIDTARDYMKAQKYEEGSIEEYGDTAKGQKMLTKVQKRAVDRVVSKKADTDPAYAKKNSDTARRAWDRFGEKEKYGEGVAEGFNGSYIVQVYPIENGKLNKNKVKREEEFTDKNEAIQWMWDYNLEKDRTGEKLQAIYKGQQGVAEDAVDEAKYQGREVPLGKKMAGDVKKSKVYVRKPNGNIVKVNFGDKKMRIKKSNPARRKSFRARHNCKNPGPRWKARYWSCRSW